MFFYSCITGFLTTVIPCSSIASVSLNVPQMHLLVCSGYSESFCSNYQRPKQRQIIIIMAKNYGENDYSDVQKNSTHSPPIIFGNFLCLRHFYNATLPTLLHFQIYFPSSRWFFFFFFDFFLSTFCNCPTWSELPLVSLKCDTIEYICFSFGAGS